MVVVKSTRPEFERMTSEDPYLQMYWYYEDLRDKYKSEIRDSRFTGDEISYASCFLETPKDGMGKFYTKCKFCKKNWGPIDKMNNYGNHLRGHHPRLYGVVSVNKYKVESASKMGDKLGTVGEEIDYPKQLKKKDSDKLKYILF
jgi:hypothetical protein